MEAITFETLPKAVTQLFDKLTNIERLLLAKENEALQASEATLITAQQAEEFLNLSVPALYWLVPRFKIPVSQKRCRPYFAKQDSPPPINVKPRKRTTENNENSNNQLIFVIALVLFFTIIPNDLKQLDVLKSFTTFFIPVVNCVLKIYSVMNSKKRKNIE